MEVEEDTPLAEKKSQDQARVRDTSTPTVMSLTKMSAKSITHTQRT